MTLCNLNVTECKDKTLNVKPDTLYLHFLLYIYPRFGFDASNTLGHVYHCVTSLVPLKMHSKCWKRGRKATNCLLIQN